MMWSMKRFFGRPTERRDRRALTNHENVRSMFTFGVGTNVVRRHWQCIGVYAIAPCDLKAEVFNELPIL